MTRAVDHDDAVLVAKIAVGVRLRRRATEDQPQVGQAPLHRRPRGAVRQRIGPPLVRERQRLSHALADREVPRDARGRRDSSRLPERELFGVRTGLVATARERNSGRVDAAEGLLRRCRLGHSGRIRGGADDDEVVVHHVVAPHRMALFHEGGFLLGSMDQQDIGVAAAAELEGLARADRHDVDAAPALRLELRKNGLEESRVHRAGRRRQLQDRWRRPRLRRGTAGGHDLQRRQESGNEQSGQNASHRHGNSLLHVIVVRLRAKTQGLYRPSALRRRIQGRDLHLDRRDLVLRRVLHRQRIETEPVDEEARGGHESRQGRGRDREQEEAE